MRPARLVAVLTLGLVVAGCGGGPTRDDADTLAAILRSSADVQRAMQPLYLCLPEEPKCYRQAGPGIVAAVERAGGSLNAAAANTDNACLKEVASLFRDSLAEYAEVGRAATAGDTAAADAALSESTKLEIAYTERFGDCGFAEGRAAEYSSTLRESNIEMLRLGEELYACPNLPCALDAAARGKTAAKQAIAAVDGLMGELAQDDEAPACLSPALRDVQEAYRAVLRFLEALEAGKPRAAQREGVLAGQLQVRAQEGMGACLSLAGP